jgi:hypothetical protein
VWEQQRKALWPLPRCLPRHTPVPDLWRECTVGFGGNSSVQSFENKYGAARHPSQDERVFFSRRKVVIGEIRAREGGSASPLVPLKEVELVWQRAKVSLYGLYQLLNRRKEHDGLGKGRAR